jgi:uncharacterized protein (TIGR03118 family)
MFTHSFSRRRARLLAVMQVAAVLAAGCGGGGYGDGGSGGGGMNPPTVSLSAQPTSIVLGAASTLTWSSSSGTTCTASGAWTGAKAAAGTESVTPTATGTQTYTLSCSGGTYSGSGSASAALTVTAPSAFSATSLVSDTAGSGALTTDANLVNAWGIAFGPTSPAWVTNNHTESSTLYDGNGKAQPAAAPLVVALPDRSAGVSFDPTGIVFNGSTDFVVSAGGRTGAARFIFDGEGGMIAGWSSSVDAAQAVTMYTDDGGAVYKGLAIASNGSGNFIYATDFHNNKIDVFDASFTKQAPSATSFAFVDPTLPAGYAPFGIQAVANGAGGATQLYVSYAQQASPGNDNTSGAGLGLVNIFDTNGTLVRHLVPAGGVLNGPWGMALAPADFGTLSNMLLVGNFGDGAINAFDPSSGQVVGSIKNAGGTAFAVPGLWGIAFGNGANNQPKNTLFYAAGTNDEANGAYGRIDVGATPPALNVPPVVALTAPTGNLSGIVTLSATAQSSINISKVEFLANGVSIGVASTSPYTVPWNTTSVADGTVTLTATATDVDGNSGASPAVTVTVANTAAAATLSLIQAQVFTPKCTGCHDGSNAPGGALPGSMNLTAGNSFANLVNVASQEKLGLMRVKPGDSTNSYVIHKLEGAAGISGSRMPLGGPFLDQATIDSIKSWIASGAPNN